MVDIRNWPGNHPRRRALVRPGALALVLVVGVGGMAAGAAAPSAAGSLDTTFGTGGRVTTDFGGFGDRADAVAVQTDGKLVAAGFTTVLSESGGATADFAVARYDALGTLDPTFGVGGKVSTDFFGDNDEVLALAALGDGTVVVAGFATPFRPERTEWDFALARYRSDGSLDPAFGVGGKVTTDFAGDFDRAEALVVEPDGKLVVAGSTTVNGEGRMALARYLANGGLDPTFGNGGRVVSDVPASAIALVLQADGRLAALGTGFGTESLDFVVARFLADGAIDASFGMGGQATVDFAESRDIATDLVLQPDGRLVAAGFIENDDPLDGADVALARLDPDGRLDKSFGRHGRVIADLTDGTEAAFALALQDDGRLIIGGTAFIGGASDFVLARYKRNGRLDQQFGSRGIVTTDFAGSFDEISALAIEDSRLVAAGVAATPDFADLDIALARYLLS
jgi:uncharacterized delta-60 repeat protein